MISDWKSVTLKSGLAKSVNRIKKTDLGLVAAASPQLQDNFELSIASTKQADRDKIAAYSNSFEWPGQSDGWSMDSSSGLLVKEHVEDVIGIDDRQKVASSKSWPYCSIGLLGIKFNGASGTGTATLIDGQYILTAGHCVYLKKYGGWISAARFAPASFNNQMPFGFGDAAKVWIHKEWLNNENSDYDIALIGIDKSFAATCGYQGVASLSDQKLVHQKVLIAGYPADKDGTQNQYYAEDFLTQIEQTRLGYLISTYQSQSGSAVTLVDQSQKAQYIVGVHTKGSPTENSATRIRDDVLQDIFGLISTAA